MSGKLEALACGAISSLNQRHREANGPRCIVNKYPGETMDPLSEYVQKRLTAGLTKPVIREELLAAGWSEKRADNAYREGLIAFGVPVPTGAEGNTSITQTSTMQAAVDLFSFVLLAIVVTSWVRLFFQSVNIALPESSPLAAFATKSSLHYSIASLLVAYPLYVVAMRQWLSRYKSNEGVTENKVTQWLTYLVLIIAAVTIAGDLITVLFSLLQGEMELRFALKALATLVVAGITFRLYYLERMIIQMGKTALWSSLRSFFVVVSIFMGASLVVGLVLARSPGYSRNEAFDAERVRHLNALAGCIENYASDFAKLPDSVSDLRKSNKFARCSASMYDPETRLEYDYSVILASKELGAGAVGDYQLCATFALAADTTTPSPRNKNTSAWSDHAAGRVCNNFSAQLGSQRLAP